ncbi:MAG: helix-turn-helix domain-containing protein [Clostridiales bacterium]|nr:helix-turn-helix domain-containing protein [Clostridiales bacterium]
MGFCEDMQQSLLEAIEMEQGNIPLTQKINMPAQTFIAAEYEKELINRLVTIRKEQHISQNQIAAMTGNKQQAISRLESGQHSPSLKLFVNMVNALGCEVQIVKKSER